MILLRRTIGRWCRNKIGNLLRLYSKSRIIYNVNLNPCLQSQKRVALVYVPDAHSSYVNLESIYHPNIAQHLLMIQVLQEMGYIIDVYPCLGELPYNLNSNCIYDLIIGFGEVYLLLCQQSPQARKILFITENAPWVVEGKYQERLSYFHQRHQKNIRDIPRMGLYTMDMYKTSDTGIALTGPYNAIGMKKFLRDIKLLPVNAISGLSYKTGKKNLILSRSHFVWFGSNGLIHKGLDILIDVFRKLPELYLDIYGICKEEISQIKLPENVCYKGYINVNSQAFIDEVVEKHAFVVSLSCSEGMMSGIATCMMYGIIPICTKETGYDDCPYVFTFDDWHIESVTKIIKECADMDIKRIKHLELVISEYAQMTYTNANFRDKLKQYIKEMG